MSKTGKTKSDKGPEDHLWIPNYPEKVKWDQTVPTYAVDTLMAKAAQQFSDRPAFDFLGKQWTWQEMNDMVNKMAKGLQKMGVGKGKKVGVFLPNSPYFVAAYYAVLRAGGTVVNYNPLYASRELAYQIEDSETDLMITSNLQILTEKTDEMLSDTRLDRVVLCPFTDILPFPKNFLFKVVKGKELSKLKKPSRYTWLEEVMDNDGKPDAVDIDPENDVAVLQYTGGTTGVPKGAELTHGNVSANVEQCAAWLYKGNPGEEKMLGVLPFFHVFAMTVVMNLAVRSGFEIIALPRFELDQTLKLIDKKKPNYFPAVPAIYNAINNHPKREQYDLTSLKTCVSGGAPLPVEVKKSFEEKTGCVVIEGYGLTESSPVACVNPIDGENKEASIGLPLPGTVIEIIDAEDKKTRMPVGEKGELCIRGPQVMKGYYNKPKETDDVLKDGLLYTGDVAVMDEDGYVFIVDRIKDMIITNGYNVYPRNVEEAIYLHPSVEECIVAGIPDQQRGELVKAWIKPKEGRELTVDDIKLFLEDKLSKMEAPKRIEIRTEPLPKTMIGKLSRKDILEEEKQGTG